MRRLAGIVVCCFLRAAADGRQSGIPDSVATDYLTFDEPQAFAFLLPYFPPYLLYDGEQLKDFIRSDEFGRVRSLLGDRKAVDAIYVRAMRLTGGNPAVSLLLSTAACFDHQIVGLRVPLLSIFFPLTGESIADFGARVRHLPSELYADTPPVHGGDRDKLQHFFGSAFFAYVLESRDPAERIGEFVETGEDAVIVDGTYDERDERANRQGQEFGLALLHDSHLYPSTFLTSIIVRQKESENHTFHCFGPEP